MSSSFDEALARGTLTETFTRYSASNPFKPGDLVKPAPGIDLNAGGVRAGMMIVLEKRPLLDNPLNVRIAGLTRSTDGVIVGTGWVEHWMLVPW